MTAPTPPSHLAVGDDITAAWLNNLTDWVNGSNAPGTITAAGSASAVSAIGLTQVGPTVAIKATFTIGTAITPVGSDGNITDTTLGQLTSSTLFPSQPRTVGSGGFGPLAKFTISTTGVIQISAITPGASLAVGVVCGIDGVYLL